MACWVIISEIYPTKVRGRGMSIATTALWLVGYLGNQLFPIMQKHLGSDGTFWCFSAGALLTIILVGWLIPETKGRSLEEITKFWTEEKVVDGEIGSVAKTWERCRMKKISFALFILPLDAHCLPYLPRTPPTRDFDPYNVDAGKVIGEIRSFQGLNGLPSPVMAGLPNLVQQYKDLRINQVRTHDAMGPTEIDSKFVLGNGELAWLIPDRRAARRSGEGGQCQHHFSRLER